MIRVLAAEVAARIAAGEVVERPASVVKELLENALDAGASRISIELTGGGMVEMRVADDGWGIERTELELAFQRHATSKLDNDTDLSHVSTLGFRGEALPSIAAVADVEIVSRTPGSDSGAALRIVADEHSGVEARGAPIGTAITVCGLFARLPARRKFLRSASSEARAAATVVSHYALAYPEVGFGLTLDGREALRTTGSGELEDAACAVYGVEIGTSMLPVASAEPSAVGVSGLVAPPAVSRSSRGYISLFVNRRWIQSRRLGFAVEQAYHGLLMTGRHPVVVLDLRMPSEEVDVNVHPTKAEVRFRDESTVFAAIQRAVRETLMGNAPVPASERRPTSEIDWPATSPLWSHSLRVAQHRLAAQGREGGAEEAVVEDSAADAAAVAVVTPRVVLPALRVIGQMGGTYIVTEGPEGMYLIDQHAAHERVLYERFSRQRQARAPDIQGLLDPLPIELPAGQAALVAAEAEALAGHGFEIEPFGEGTYLLRAVPAALMADGDARAAVERFMDLMEEEGEGDRRDRVAMSLACHGAIRAGKTLALEEMRELARELEESESPHTCPHGRPTMIHMSADLLAREFGRR